MDFRHVLDFFGNISYKTLLNLRSMRHWMQFFVGILWEIVCSMFQDYFGFSGRRIKVLKG